MTRSLLVLVAALLSVGQEVPDPFDAVTRSPDSVAGVRRPDGFTEADSIEWGHLPRRAMVAGLAALYLRGELTPVSAWKHASSFERPPRVLRREDLIPGVARKMARAHPGEATPRPALRLPALASWVPKDAAVAFFASIDEAERCIASLAGLLDRHLPALVSERGRGDRAALERAVERLLLPTIWRANPGVPTGTGAVAIVISDPDLRGAPDVALLVQVTDLGRLVSQRRASFRWESTRTRFRTDGLDARTDDGSVRSFFGVDGGIAVFSTTKSLRRRIIDAGRSGGLPGAVDGLRLVAAQLVGDRADAAILYVPEGFLAAVDSLSLRARRMASLRCEAMRLLVDGRNLTGCEDVFRVPGGRLECPTGGKFHVVPSRTGSTCSIHGSALHPVPLGDVDESGLHDLHYERLLEQLDLVPGGIPAVACWFERPGSGKGPHARAWFPGEPRGAHRGIQAWTRGEVDQDPFVQGRMKRLLLPRSGGDVTPEYERLTGLRPPRADRRTKHATKLPTTLWKNILNLTPSKA
ncbi:MAG: hypothetical protein ACYTDX_06700, partial [Planctomycetota bacterium]